MIYLNPVITANVKGSAKEMTDGPAKCGNNPKLRHRAPRTGKAAREAGTRRRWRGEFLPPRIGRRRSKNRARYKHTA